MADVAYVLWTRFLRYDPRDPAWPDRDRFVLSAGHASMLLYALLHLSGYDLPLDELKHFRQWGSQHARPPRVRPHRRRRDHDRPARPGHRQRASAWRSPRRCSPRASTRRAAIVDRAHLRHLLATAT